MHVGLLTHMAYSSPYGGAQKALRASCEALHALGHRVSVFEHLQTGTLPGARASGALPVATSFLRDPPTALLDAVATSGVDRLLVPCEDPWQRPLHLALQTNLPVVALAQTPATLPFGPGAARPDGRNTEALRSASACAASSRFLAAYIREHSGIAAEHCPLPTQPRVSAPPSLHRLPGASPQQRRSVLMINPSTEKGIALLLALADALPSVCFQAVLGWATTDGDVIAMRARDNIQILASRDDLAPYYAHARYLLIPSLWLENVPLIAEEAMLWGVPVIGSDLGGIPEVTCGTADLLPVVPLDWTRRGGRPVAVVADQPLDVWRDLVARRMAEEDSAWQSRSARAIAAARRRLHETTVESLAALLNQVV